MAKKWLILAVLLSLSVATATPSYAQKMRPAEPEIAAKAWILVDANTGKVILEKNADDQLPPASLAKMMTTYLVSNEISANRLKEEEDLKKLEDEVKGPPIDIENYTEEEETKHEERLQKIRGQKGD